MRDWNIEGDYKDVLYDIVFLVRLWGIETKPNLRLEFQVGIVFSSPMRDWNFFQEQKKPCIGKVFSSPMRDWNIVKFKISLLK